MADTIRYALIRAREQKRLKQAQLAARLGVTVVTLSRWENGHTFPHPSQIERLCRELEKTARELGLDPSSAASSSSTWFNSLTTRLFAPVMDTHHVSPHDLCLLQVKIAASLEKTDLMEINNPNYHFTRREALACLATFPQITLNNDAVDITKSSVTERVLKECAAGIAACEELSRGSYDDMARAYQALTSYMPGLETLVQQSSSQYRSGAALLLYQCFHIKSNIVYIFEGTKQEIVYAKEAVKYAKESRIRAFYINALRLLARAYFSNQDYTQALSVAQKAASQFQLPGSPIQPSLKSSVHAGLIRYLAKENKPGVEDVRKLAYDTFSQEADPQAEELPRLSLHSYANIVRQDAVADLYMRKPSEALKKFGQILDYSSEQVKPKLVVQRNLFGGIAKEATLASLKVPNSKKDKDVSIRLWKAGWQTSREFHSKEGLQKAIGLYEIMEGIWPEESDVLDLHDLIEEYLKEQQHGN